jgi:tetratricopeptide (TPR) repeat protein
MIGRALGSIGEWDAAERAFQQAVQISPGYAEAWGFLGEARYHLNGGGKADLDQADRLAPDSPVIRALMALYWRREGQPAKAMPYLEAIALAEPKEPTWQVEIGNTWVETGDLIKARAAYQKAVDLAPDISLYWQYLARFSIEYNVDIHTLGLGAARQAVVLAPEDTAALDTMGWALVNLGDYATAERFLQHALEKDATYAPACLHMGQLYLQRQENGQAYLYLKRAAALAGDTPTGRFARRLLSKYFGGGD